MRCETMLILVLLGGVNGLPQVFADYECVKGYHDITTEESATMIGVLEAARAAVPAPPNGWINTLNDDSVSPPRSVCLDFSPWTYSYSRHYSRVEGAEEREQAEAAAGQQIRAMMAERQPRLDALMAQSNELSAQYAAAATSGDQAKAESIQVEIDRVSAEFDRLMNEGDPAAVYESHTASHYADLEMNISVTINPMRESPMDGAQPLQASGAHSAYQWTSGDDGQHGTALVLFGAWRPGTSGHGLEPAGIPGATPEQPQAISARIQAHKDRLPAVIEATNFSAIAALLER